MKQAAASHKAERQVNVLLNVALPYAIRLWARRIAWEMLEWLASKKEWLRRLDKGLDYCLNNIDVARAGEYMVRAERFFVDIFKFTHATGDQNGFKPRLEAR